MGGGKDLTLGVVYLAFKSVEDWFPSPQITLPTSPEIAVHSIIFLSRYGKQYTRGITAPCVVGSVSHRERLLYIQRSSSRLIPWLLFFYLSFCESSR